MLDPRRRRLEELQAQRAHLRRQIKAFSGGPPWPTGFGDDIHRQQHAAKLQQMLDGTRSEYEQLCWATGQSHKLVGPISLRTTGRISR